MSALFTGTEKTKASSVTTIPGPTPAEIELIEVQVEASKESLEFLRILKAELPELSEQLETDLLNFTSITQQVAQQLEAGTPEFDRATDLAFSALEAGGAPTEFDIELVQNAVTSAFELGAEQIRQGTQEQITDIRDILAPARGLRGGDAPIQDQAQRVAQQGVKELGSLSRALAATGAQALLDLPLQRQAQQANIALGQQQLSQQALLSRQGLAEAAFTNRLKLEALRGDTQLSLAGLQPSGAASLATLTQARIAQPTIVGTSSTISRAPILQQIGQFVGNLAGAAAPFAPPKISIVSQG